QKQQHGSKRTGDTSNHESSEQCNSKPRATAPGHATPATAAETQRRPYRLRRTDESKRNTTPYIFW
ncbi:hypothetical protein CSUI_008919, partial [Cystoisospora suis]